MAHLFSSFSTVALAAEHLTVLDDRASTIAPRGDVIALHELKVELPATRLAEMILLLPYCQLDVLGKCPQVEVVLVARQNVWDDARLLLNLAVTHQL